MIQDHKNRRHLLLFPSQLMVCLYLLHMRSDKLRAGGLDVGVWNLKVRFMARKCVVVLGVCVCMFVEQTGTMAGISNAFCVCSGLLCVY